MKCAKCGAELSDDTKFCSYCGNKIEASPEPPEEEKATDSTISYGYGYTTPNGPAQETPGEAQMSKPQAGKAKGRASSLWSKLSTYAKIATVAIVAFVLLGLVALLAGKTAAIVIAVVQIVLAVVSVLMHRGIIKLEQKQLWLKWLILVIAILFTVLNIMSYSWGKDSPGGTSKPDTPPVSSTSEPSDAVSTAATPYGATECVGQEHSAVKSEFASAGFVSVTVEPIEDLKMIDTEKVNAVESVSVGGTTDFSKGQEFDKNDEVIIRYHAYKKCNVTLHIDFVPNLMFSKYNVDLLVNDINRGTLEHGEDKDFEFSVDPGEYTLIFENEDSSSVKGEVTLTVDCNLEASYKISCFNDKVSVETLYVDRLTELAEGEVKVDVAASEYEYKNYEEVTTALKTLGFTNIKYEILYDITLGLTSDGTVKSVSIAGQTEFTRGNVFPADAEIVITYHMPEEDDPNNPHIESSSPTDTSVSYSTNDMETAKNGNSGVFSYKSIGGIYDVYWIIDFDEGYVYTFCDGNGDTTCDRLKIDSGNLNDGLIITYHDYDDIWSYGLHFKWRNQPDHLVLLDNDGFELDFYPTSLENALAVRQSKTIHDY